MTPAQLKLLGMARNAAHKATALDEADYRTILRSVAHVESGRDIRTPEQFERVMALLEERGYRHPKGPTYFRDKVARVNNGIVTDRQLQMIDTLITQTGYRLPGLCQRFSRHRTTHVNELTSGEAYNLIEMLKAVVDRTQDSGLSTQDSSKRAGRRAARISGSPASAPGLFGQVPPASGASAPPADRAPVAALFPTAAGPGFGFSDDLTDDDVPF